MNRRDFDKLTIKEARELVMAALEVAEAMVVQEYGAGHGNSKRYDRACAVLITAAAKASARLLAEAVEDDE